MSLRIRFLARRHGSLAHCQLPVGAPTLASRPDSAADSSGFHAGGAFGPQEVGAVYLVGAAVAQAAPTPGGLGAMEAALIGGLVAAGLDNTIAVPAVFLFRLFTFWVPVLPGWFAFQWLQRHDYL